MIRHIIADPGISSDESDKYNEEKINRLGYFFKKDKFKKEKAWCIFF